MDSHRKIKQILFLSFAFLTIQNANAQTNPEQENQLSVSLQLRPKSELRSGAFRPLAKGEEPAALISQRSRLNVNYQYKNLLTVQVSPQIVTVWGEEPLTQGAKLNNGVALFEAWAKLNLSKNTTLQIGRQVISLDDERFFGELDWAQGGRSHDAISLHVQKEKFAFKAFAAFNQNYAQLYGSNSSNPAGNLFSSASAANYKTMQTLWAKFNVDDKNTISLLANNLGFQNAATALDNAKVYYAQTIGANYFHTGKNWKFNLSAYTQFGKNAIGVKTSGYMLAIYADRKLNKKWNIGLGTDYLSGNDVGVANQKNKIFTPYFATGHKFYGHMDYFYAGNGHSGTGLVDIYLNLQHKANDKWNFGLTIHQFLSPNKIKDINKDYASNLGEEFDFNFGYTLHKYAKLTGGYSAYANTSSLNFIKNVNQPNNLQHWFWLSLNINPNIFNLKF